MYYNSTANPKFLLLINFEPAAEIMESFEFITENKLFV